MIKFLILVTVLLASNCASHGPVLYPNEHLKMVGEEQAWRDIEECDRLASCGYRNRGRGRSCHRQFENRGCNRSSDRRHGRPHKRGFPGITAEPDP